MQNRHRAGHPEIRDYGTEPFIFNICHAAEMNQNFRTTLWTGQHMQLTLMSIPVKGDVGVEMHADVDQFFCVESGHAKVYLGSRQNAVREAGCITDGYAILIPAGTWHNVVNAGNRPLKLYSLYAPPQHPAGTVNKTKTDETH